MTGMEIQNCVRCGGRLKAPQGINVTGDPAIAIFVSGLTVGVRPRIKSRAQRKVFCMGCAASIALGPVPENGEFNTAIYHMLRELVAADRTIVEAAWTQLTTPTATLRRMPGSRPDRSLEAPVLKVPALEAAS
jgi:hypothetical protein